MGGYSEACQDASTTAVVTIIKGWTNSSCIVYMHTTCDRYVLYCIAYHYVLLRTCARLEECSLVI